MDELSKLLKLTVDARDSRRPTMEMVVDVLKMAFGQIDSFINLISDGPATWVWEDTAATETGFPRFYILSQSTSEGTEGYPLFTIRQGYSVVLDSWVTFSTLVIGPDPETISHTIAMTISQHAGSFAGSKYVTSVMAYNNGSPGAGLVAVQQILESSPQIIEEADLSISDRIMN